MSNEEYTRTIAKNLLTIPCYLPGVRKLHSGFLMQENLGRARVMQKDLPDGTDFCFQIQVDHYLPVFRKFDLLALQKRQARHNEMGLFFLMVFTIFVHFLKKRKHVIFAPLM